MRRASPTRAACVLRACRRLNAAHGKTYYLATCCCRRAKRPYVHALYGFARYADEFVDYLDDPRPRGASCRWGERFLADLDRGATPTTRSAGPRSTPSARLGHPARATSSRSSTSMQMDLTVTYYETYDDLRGYIYGSAAVIGLQMVPMLEPARTRAPRHAARRSVRPSS